MYVGTFETISNRETWSDSFSITDDNGVAFDISTATAIVVAVRDPQSKTQLLYGSLADGTVTWPHGGTDGVFSWTFADTAVRVLCAKTYDVGITITLSGAVSQLLTAKLPVVDGIVP